MQEKPFKTDAPFGIATKRFNKIGFHPSLDKSGAMKREITKLGPGSFNPEVSKCKSKRGANWKNKLELEEFSKFLGFRNADILHRRQFDQTLRGPGSYEINEEIWKKETSSKMDNVGLGSAPRMAKVYHGDDAPPPCTYFKSLTETFHPSKRTFSKLPTFEYDGLIDRFKSSARTYHLPPNLYNLNDKKNVSDIVERCISARGPYDCFTGPRDGTTIKNYFSPSDNCAPEYFYIKPGSLQNLLHSSSKKRYGLFLKANRFPKKPTVRHMLNDISLCYKDPNAPGPAHYDLSKSSGIQKLVPSQYPFNSSNINARPPINWKILPGPGRYTPKAPRCMKLKRPSWVFLSKAGRELYKPQTYSLFEK